MQHLHRLTVLLASLLWLATAGAESSAPSSALDQDAAFRLSQNVIGKVAGEYTLNDRTGRPVRFSAYRGKPLLVSFVYTGCFQICPVTTRSLAKAVKAAQDALGADSFTTVTIGFNVPFDTPRAMDSFARQQGVNLPNWHFLSPNAATVRQLTADLGFSYALPPRSFDHIEQLTIVDADGRVYRQVYGDRFEAQMLVIPLKELLSGMPSKSGPLAGMLDKIRLFCTVYDPASGTYRRNYSIFIEIFIGITILGAVVFSLFREWRRNRHSGGV